jgi:predicted nucleic-acid-binding protein
MLVDDGSAQCRAASGRLLRDHIFVTTAVMLEAEWVLRSSFRMGVNEVTALFQLFCGNERLIFDDADTVHWAVEAMSNGFDFADAIHLHSSRSCEGFLTFDRSLMKKAKKHVGFLAVSAP